MRLDTSQQMRTDMRLRMAPRMIQSMEILQLPLMALQERIDQELSENPVLVDLRETSTPEAEPEVEGRGRPPPEPPRSPPSSTADDWAESFGEAHRMSRAALSEEADRKHDAMQNMASRPRSLHDDLSDQLGFLDADPTVRAAGRVHHLQPRRQRLPQPRPRTRSSATSAATSRWPRPRRPSAWSRSSTRPASAPGTSASACSFSSRPTSPAATSCTS